MKNFPFEHNGETYWYSRSVACTMYLFVYARNVKQWYVLVSQRGPGCPSEVGKWNVPGGYLDFDETLEQAAIRECFEETGVGVYEKIHLASITTDLYSKNQNVVCAFYATRKVDDITLVALHFTKQYSENNEVDNIELWRVGWFFECPDEAAKEMAFGQDEIIRNIFTKYIKCSWWRKLMRRLNEKNKIEI